MALRMYMWHKESIASWKRSHKSVECSIAAWDSVNSEASHKATAPSTSFDIALHADCEFVDRYAGARGARRRTIFRPGGFRGAAGVGLRLAKGDRAVGMSILCPNRAVIAPAGSRRQLLALVRPQVPAARPACVPRPVLLQRYLPTEYERSLDS